MKKYFTFFTIVLFLTLIAIQPPTYAQWQKNFIDANFTYPTVFQIGDIDSDGDLDVVISSYQLNDVVWYENNGEIPATWEKQTIDDNLSGALCVSIADIDGDDTLDVAVTGENANNVVWYKNSKKGTSWLKHTITTNLIGANWVNIADLDGDLDMDVIADGNLSDNVIWCENNGDEPITWTKHNIDENLDNARQMRIADIDGDTDPDIVAAGYDANDIVWYENSLPDTVWNKHLVDGNLNGAVGLSLGDIDGDSKIDIVATGATANEIVWYSNNEPAWTKYPIANLNVVRAVDLTDIDGDNDLDILTTSSSDNDVVWFNNDYPNTNWTKNLIDNNLGGARAVYSADIDNDNDQDVFSVGQTANDVVWYKNPYASQTIESSFEFEGLTRNYEVHLPPNHQPNMPVILTLHGHGDNVEMIKNYSQMHEFGFENGFITVYPAAINSKWNTGNDPAATANDVGFISALLDTLLEKYSIDSTRIYCCGFGQGGAMSYKLVGELSHRFTAAASIEGLMCEAMLPTSAPVREVPILHIHGTEDTYEPWEGTDDPLYLLSVDETIIHWVGKNNCSPFFNNIPLPDIDPNDGCTVEKISYNDNSNDTTVILYKVNEGGHNWPGAPNDFNWEGNKTGDINANTEIWNFFKNYSNPLVSVSKNKIDIPSKFRLNQNYPNPFNPATIINYSIPEKSFVSLKIFDVLGREVSVLVNKEQPVGNYELEFDASQLTSGIYFYRIQAGKYIETKKLVVLK